MEDHGNRVPAELAPVLILGAGINGAALARELAWQGVPVVVVDRADISSGATAYSSRLIHGGLRYLEYGDFRLVAEALAERRRLLATAPHHVKPLRLMIPVARRLGGLLAGGLRFIGRERWARRFAGLRGLWVIRAGLAFYDYLARDPQLPRAAVQLVGAAHTPAIAPGVAHWWCSYFDAQIAWPERYVIDLLEDGRIASVQFGQRFEVITYARAELNDAETSIFNRQGNLVARFKPSAIVNATGAWVDQTLNQLHVDSPQLMGGTKGSHLVVDNPRLRQWLGKDGIYVEAADGRPVFILPWDDLTLVGTTDLPFTGDPVDVVATPPEIDYLLAAVNHLLPGWQLQPHDVLLHYCGVRPLPATSASTPAAISRAHWLEEHLNATVPTYSVIGGKLTTSRSLAESACDTLLTRLNLSRRHSTRDAVLPSSRGYPPDRAMISTQINYLAERHGLSIETVAAVWNLFGTRTSHILEHARDVDDRTLLSGTLLPRRVVAWVIEHEWAESLDDLIERRLLLLYDRGLCRETLGDLAALLVERGKLDPRDVDSTIEGTRERIRQRHGRVI